MLCCLVGRRLFAAAPAQRGGAAAAALPPPPAVADAWDKWSLVVVVVVAMTPTIGDAGGCESGCCDSSFVFFCLSLLEIYLNNLDMFIRYVLVPNYLKFARPNINSIDKS